MGLKVGFRGRLIGAMVTLVVLVSLVIGATFMLYLFEDEKTRALEQLAVSERLTDEVMERRTDQILSRLRVVIQDFGFRSAVASGDLATINSALENHSQRAGAGFAVLMDANGEIITQTGDIEPNDLPADLFDRAQQQGIARSLTYLPGKGCEILVVPVEGPGLRAWLVAGFTLGQNLAEAIDRLSGTPVIFRAKATGADRYQPFAATLAVDAQLQSELASADRQNSVLVSANYFTRVVDLNEPGQPSIQALLLSSRQESLNSYYHRAMEVGLLGAAIVLAAIVMAMLIARFLGRPVLELAAYADAVGRDENPTPPDIRTGGELAQLRNALTDMLGRLRAREEQIRYTASHDEVTGLGNKHALMGAISQSLESAVPRSLIGIRIDDLANINDTLGLEFGDEVLGTVAQRVTDCIGDAQLIARSGGTEFTVLLAAQADETLNADARALYQKIVAPMQIGRAPFSLRVTMITLQLPRDATSINQLRRRLNLTFERAFKAPEGMILPYQPGQDENHLRQLQLISDLPTAIANCGLHMNYQPKLDIHSGRLVQVEALVRWIHPELGFISPEEFIYLAERSGQIHDLTAHILQRVAQDGKDWAAKGLDIGVAINLSAMDLSWPMLAEHINQTFDQWHHGLERITLEVTESAIMEDPEEAMKTLNKLRDLGLTLSVDDFGTGYSSLSQLRQLPVQEIKIDKSFVLKLSIEPQDQLIVQSTINMAHGLGLKVVAEGIEDLDAWHLLQDWGCNLGQGFYLSRPVAPDALPETARQLEQRLNEFAANEMEHS